MNAENLIAAHIREIPPSGIRKFFDIASEMKDIISLGVGEPDFITPWNIRDVAIHSIEKGKTHYTSNHGLPELREKVCDYLKFRFGVNYDKSVTMITVGASEALDLAFRAILNPGEEVLIPAPSYVSYEPGVRFCGGIAVPIPTFEEQEFILTPENIEKVVTEKTKAIVVPYPNNPSGAIMTRDQLNAILPVIKKHGLFVISDEIYAELTYGQRHQSIAKGEEERTLLISGFSKAFAMTGWRVGYACGPKPVIEAMVKIHQYAILCAPIVGQIAALEALTYEMHTEFKQVRDMRHQYDRRRMFMLEKFKEMGLSCFEPRGAFYIFPNIKKTGLSSEEFCKQLITQKKVACVPGSAFGKGGEGYIRCSYATSLGNITTAVSRIADFLRELNA